MIAVLWLAAAWAAPLGCAASVPVTTFEDAVARAELGIHALDAEAVGQALGQADASLACADAPLGVDALARWYRARAIDRLAHGDRDAAIGLFRAAKSLQPAYVLDPTLGQPIQDAFAAAEPDASARPLPPPTSGTFLVDGRPGTGAPADRPYVLQWLGDDGAVRGTALVGPAETVPFPVAPLPAPAPVVAAPVTPMPAPVTEDRGHPSRALALSSLGTAVVAGAGIAAAAAIQEEVLSSPHPSDDLSGLVVSNRIVGYGAGGFAVAAVGLGATAVLVGRW